MMCVGDGPPAQYSVNNGSNCMSAVFLQNRVQSHFRLRLLMAFVFILMTFSIFWIHLGPNWALEAWARDTWYFLDFKGGSRIQSRLAVGGDSRVWRPTVPSRLYLQDPVFCIQDAEYRLVCRMQDYTYSHSLVAPDKQGPADI